MPSPSFVVVLYLESEGVPMSGTGGESLFSRMEDLHRQHGGTQAYSGEGQGYYLFDRVADAARCAWAAQRIAGGARVRMSIHQGEALLTGERPGGAVFTLSQRIAAMGLPGSVLLSGEAQAALAEDPAFQTAYLTDLALQSLPAPLALYALNAEGLTVPVLEDLPRPYGESPQPTHTPMNHMSEEEKNTPRGARSLRSWILLGTMALLGAWVIWQFVLPRPGEKAAASESLSLTPARAYLEMGPILAEDSALQFIGDGLAEDLRRQLGHVTQLRVFARGARGVQSDFRVEGTYRQEGDQIQIDLRMISGADGKEVWDNLYEGSWGDIFSVREEYTGEILKRLGRELATPFPQAAFAAETPSAEAYVHYLRARNLIRAENTAALQEAVHEYQQAIGLDPTYAKAAAGLGEAYASLARIEPSFSALGLQSSAKAVALAPLLSESHGALGFSHWVRGEDSAAYVAFRKAVSLNPSNLSAYPYLINLTASKVDQLTLLESAIRLSPGRPQLQAQLAAVYAFFGAGQAADSLMAMVPDSMEASTLYHRIDYLFHLARWEAVDTLFAEQAALEGGSLRILPWKAALAGYEGDIDEIGRSNRVLIGMDSSAVRWPDWVWALQARNDPEAPALRERGIGFCLRAYSYKPTPGKAFELAALYFLAGEEDLAAKWLQQAVAAGWLSSPVFAQHPLGVEMRKHPQLQPIWDDVDRVIADTRATI